MVSMTLLIEAFNQHEKEVLYRTLVDDLGPQNPPTGPANGPDLDDSDESDADNPGPKKAAENARKRPGGKDKKCSGRLPDKIQKRYEQFQKEYLEADKGAQKEMRLNNPNRNADELEILAVMQSYFPNIALYQNQRFKTEDDEGNERCGWIYIERIDVSAEILPILYWLGFQRAGKSKLVHKVGIESKRAYSQKYKAGGSLERVA